MSIKRAPRPESNFYLLDKSISEDRRLSWAARGLLIYLLGKPDNWQVSVKNLMNETADAVGRSTGRDGVYGLINELIQCGYIARTQGRGDDGQLGEAEYVVSEKPLPENPDTVPLTALPDTANPTQISIDNKPRTETNKSKRGQCNMPEDFKPNDQHRQMAQKLKVDLDNEFDQFKDYHAAKGSKMKCWDAALRTWIRNAAKFSAGRTPPPRTPQPHRRHTGITSNVGNGMQANEDGSFKF